MPPGSRNREELASIRGDALATLGYVANWRAIFTHNDYWAMFRSPSPLEHTWSLAIEEQFYLLWPLAVVVLLRGRDAVRGARRVLVASLALAAFSFVFMQVSYDSGNPSPAYYSTVTRMGSILLGAALAAWLARPAAAVRRTSDEVGAGRRVLEIGALAAIAGLALAWTRLDGGSTTLYRGGLLLCAIATTVVIAAAVHPRRGPVSRALSFRPLCAAGLISYGLYLWHWPIYVYLDSDRVHLTGWPLLAVRVGVTLVVAVLSYRYVEQPIRLGIGAPARIRRLAPAARGRARARRLRVHQRRAHHAGGSCDECARWDPHRRRFGGRFAATGSRRPRATRRRVVVARVPPDRRGAALREPLHARLLLAQGLDRDGGPTAP